MAGDTNPRLAAQRSQFFEYLDDNPSERDMFIKALLSEGGVRGLQANFEQALNYGCARGFHDTHQIIHSGFYGPVNRGEAQRRRITPSQREAANAALKKVRAGSNRIGYRTDQGIPGDPNFAREKANPIYGMEKIDGCWFAHHPMFGVGSKSWAAKQIAADVAAGIISEPHDTSWIQHSLNLVMDAGLDEDGDYGELTTSAVKDFQTKFGLEKVDGLCGTETTKALEQELAKKTPPPTT